MTLSQEGFEKRKALRVNGALSMDGAAATRVYSAKYLNRIKELMFSTVQGLLRNKRFLLDEKMSVVVQTLDHAMVLSDGVLRSIDTSGENDDNDKVDSEGNLLELENNNKTTAEQVAEDGEERGYINKTRDSHFLVQTGAAEGRAIHKNMNKKNGFDAQARAEVLGTTGLRLLQHIIRSKELMGGCSEVLAVEVAASGVEHVPVRVLKLKRVIRLVVECFTSSKQDALFNAAAKTLHRLHAIWSGLIEKHVQLTNTSTTDEDIFDGKRV